MSFALTHAQASTHVRKSISNTLFSGSGRREEDFFGRPQKSDSSRISQEDLGEESDTRRLVSSLVSPRVRSLSEDRKDRVCVRAPLGVIPVWIELQDIYTSTELP